VTHQVAARDAASVHFCPSITRMNILVPTCLLSATLSRMPPNVFSLVGPKFRGFSNGTHKTDPAFDVVILDLSVFTEAPCRVTRAY